MQTFELRQYAMQPGKRDAFVAFFDREFLEPQEAHGACIVGQFRDLDDPDRFVWIRGHADMPSRKRMMHAFYDGEHWKQHREAANACIADSDNVLLLKPAWEGAGFAVPATRAAPGSPSEPSGVITANICSFGATLGEASRHAFRQMIPDIEALGATFLAALISETAENNFPRHPIREGENVFVWFALSERDSPRFPLPPDLTDQLTKPVERLRLQPTPRSRLRV
ncbi:MAG TPA: NIPSNAP family protein [Rhizomicrobium sp.]|jgi:hypothetical protein|nr:NIPSNAP family protein [Rhizomicrobium sp.]